MPHCKGPSTAIDDGRQKPARQQEGGRRPLQYEKKRGDGRKMWEKDEDKVGEQRAVQVFIPWEKAAGEAMHGALPEGAAPWPGQERAALSPSARLYNKREI